MYRNTYVEIDEKKLENNARAIMQKYNQYQYYIGVVKANCYGHGFYAVKSLIKAGINYLATSSLEEALEVRKMNQNIPILCLEPIDSKYIEEIEKNNITVTIDSKTSAMNYAKAKIKGTLKVHLKIDSGMNRLGMKSKKEVSEAISLLEENEKIEMEGVYTHMATTGVYDVYYDKQVSRFQEIISCMDLSKIKIIHMGRSLTLVQHKKLDFVNGIRLGIVLFGLNGSLPKRTGLRGLLSEWKRDRFLQKNHISPTTRQNDLNVKTAFKLYTEVMSIHKMKKGEFVGYGANYIAKEDMMVATLPIGYADGMTASLKTVQIGSKKYEIVGDICMDMTMIKIDSKVKLHDKVEIFGDSIGIREASKKIGCNAYRLFTGITSRVPRVYQDGTEIKY